MIKYPSCAPDAYGLEAFSNGVGSPERMLLAAVLEIAIRDLSSKNKKIRDSAVRWFEDTTSYSDNHLSITYELVISILQFKAAYLQAIRERVILASQGLPVESKWHITRHRVQAGGPW